MPGLSPCAVPGAGGVRCRQRPAPGVRERRRPTAPRAVDDRSWGRPRRRCRESSSGPASACLRASVSSATTSPPMPHVGPRRRRWLPPAARREHPTAITRPVRVAPLGRHSRRGSGRHGHLSQPDRAAADQQVVMPICRSTRRAGLVSGRRPKLVVCPPPPAWAQQPSVVPTDVGRGAVTQHRPVATTRARLHCPVARARIRSNGRRRPDACEI